MLGPSTGGALPASVCGEGGSHANDCLRTIPPRENGGNMDVQQQQIGTKIIFPCFIDGCGLFAGDIHYAKEMVKFQAQQLKWVLLMYIELESLRVKVKRWICLLQ